MPMPSVMDYTLSEDVFIPYQVRLSMNDGGSPEA